MDHSQEFQPVECALVSMRRGPGLGKSQSWLALGLGRRAPCRAPSCLWSRKKVTPPGLCRGGYTRVWVGGGPCVLATSHAAGHCRYVYYCGTAPVDQAWRRRSPQTPVEPISAGRIRQQLPGQAVARPEVRSVGSGCAGEGRRAGCHSGVRLPGRFRHAACHTVPLALNWGLFPVPAHQGTD